MRARRSCARPKAPLRGAFFYVLWLCWAPAAAADGGVSAAVRAAIDGDTLLLRDGRLVRLIGINAPELGKDGAPDQALARAAQARLTALTTAAAAPVVLTHERERRDRYGRLLAHVVLADGRFVGDILVQEGLAFAIAVPPNVARIDALQAAERRARAAGRGVWALPNYEAKPADRLSADDTGFRRVRGRVLKAVEQRHGWYLQLGAKFSLYLPRADIGAFSTAPAALSGKMIEARGWITRHQGRLRMKIQHPAMMAVTGSQ